MKILSRYILKEFLSNLVLGLLIFTFVILLDHLFELVDLLLNKGAGIGLTLQLLFLLLPSSLSLTLPTASLLAALLTFGRLSENNEVTAIRASGLPAWSYIQTPLWSALLAVLFLIPFNISWAPHAHAHFRQLYVKVLQRNPLIRIEEKIFFEIGDYHLYVERKARRSKRLTGVTIYKTSVDQPPLRIFAATGEAAVEPAQGMLLDLHDGRIEQIDPSKPEQWSSTEFKTYRLTIPLQGSAQASSRSIEEMDNRELQKQIMELRSKGLPSPLFSCQKQLRWAMALTPFLFVCLGIPLAIQIHRGGRAIGFAVSLCVMVGYYVILMGGVGFGQRGQWPPWLGVWLANTVVLGGAVILHYRFSRR